LEKQEGKSAEILCKRTEAGRIVILPEGTKGSPPD